MGLYAGMDLHARNTFIGIIDEDHKRVFERRVPNDLVTILATLKPYHELLLGVAVESTYNWYWLVDGLMDHGYDCLHLASPAAFKQYEGIKHTDDRHDAFWLATMLALGILPTGYIYPRESRSIRDLLRKRSFLVSERTSLILNLESMIARETGEHISSNEIKKLESDDIEQLLLDEYLVKSANASVNIICTMTKHINDIEKAVKEKMKVRKPFVNLLTVPGIGNILALTIMLEVGDIGRFPKVGNFSSYCRCVSSKRLSDGKKKGKGNSKNGNRYLAWAFLEAAHVARRVHPKLSKYYQKKLARTNKMVAMKALSNKLSRACYYIIRDQVPFRETAML